MLEINNDQIQRAWIKQFWNESTDVGRKQRYSSLNKKQTIKLLLKMGELKIKYKNQIPLYERRCKFNVCKFKRHSLKSHSKCFACKNDGNVRHHIIWLKNGGINSKINLVTLCYSCHAEIHPWLKRSL